MSRDATGRIKCTSIYSRIVTLNSESNDLNYAGSGGLIGVGLRIDPTLARADRLVGHVLGLKGHLPDVYIEIEVTCMFLPVPAPQTFNSSKYHTLTR